MSRRHVFFLILFLHQSLTLPPVSARDDAREQKVYERYLSLLRRNPRQGTALTRVLKWHSDHKSLDAFQKELESAVQDSPADGASWMLLGLVAEERSNYATALDAYQNAERNRSNDHLAPWYVGRILQKQRKTTAARAALERALKHKPSRTDAHAVFQELATLYAGASAEDSTAFWKRFEQAFPDDPRVQEQLVETLIQQGQTAEAIKRLTAAAALQREPTQRIQLQLRIADIQIRSGDTAEGRQNLIRLQNSVRPGSWLFTEIRRRLDAVYFEQRDLAGLIEFYRMQSTRDVSDTDAILRLSRYLVLNGQPSEATNSLRRAVLALPRNADVRSQLIVRLRGEEAFEEAIELLESQERLSISEVEQLGRLYLNRTDMDLSKRQQMAIKAWQRQLEGREEDAVAWSRVAGLCRDSGLSTQAITFYEAAIRLAPEAGTYREYLGELYHQQGNPTEALKAWRAIIRDPESADQWSQLARILHGRGYSEESLSAWSKAVSTGVTVSTRMEYARQLRESGDPILAIEQLDEAVAATSDSRVRQQILNERLRCLAESGQLETQARQQAQLLAEGAGTAEDWLLLARTEEALNHWTRAASAARMATRLQSNSIEAWTVAARVLERGGQLADASAAWSQIASLDPRNQSSALRRIVTLEQNLGRADNALAAAEKLISSGPNSKDSLQFVTEVCFDLKRPDRAVDFLTRAVQGNPADRWARALRADAYARQFRTSDAISDWWVAFELSQGQPEALVAVRALTVLFQRTGRLDELAGRLDALPREEESAIDPVICGVELWKTAGQFGKARAILQTLPQLTTDARLLEEATILSEQLQDFESAAEYQRLQNQLKPSKQGVARLAGLLVRAGKLSPSEAEWMKHGGEFASPQEILGSIDHALEMNLLDDASGLGRRMNERFPNDWECLLRMAVTAWKRGQLDECEQHCDALLALTVESAQIAWRLRKSAESIATVDASETEDTRPGLIRNLERLRQFGRRLHLAGGGTAESRPWAAETFSEARSIATFLKLRRAFDNGDAEQFVADCLTDAEQQGAPTGLRWDCWTSIQALRLVEGRYSSSLMKSAHLVRAVDSDDAHLAWLYSVAHRTDSRFRKTEATPLSDEFLSATVESFERLRKSQPGWLSYTDGLELVIRELSLADSEDRSQELIASIEQSADSIENLQMLFEWSASSGDVSRMLSAAEGLARRVPNSDRSLPWQRRFATAAWHALQQDDQDAVKGAILVYLRTAAEVAATRLTGDANPGPGYHSSQRVQILRGHSDWAIQQVDALNSESLCGAADIEFLANVSQMFRGLNRQAPIDFCDSFSATRTDSVGRSLAQTAAAHLEYLRGRKESAFTRLVRAAELQPDNGMLRLFIARYQHEQGASADALALVTTIQPRGYEMVRQTNLLMLDLAEATGNSAQTDEAVRGLLNLRLDKATAGSLSSQLKRLGRRELQTQVDQRVAINEGGDMDVMVALMRQKKEETELTIACEIAHQILRQTRGQEIGNRRGESIASIRRSAIQTLHAGNQLAPLVEALKQTLERDGTSVTACEKLVEYFSAIQDREQLAEYQARLLELKPVTVDSLLVEAEEAERSRRFTVACDRYLAVFDRDPQRYALNYYQYLDTFDQGGRLNDLADLLLKKDLRKLQNNYFVVNETIQRLFKAAQGSPRSSELRRAALDLFASAWELFPNNRTFLIGEISDPEIWELPLMVEYVQNGLIPATRQQAVASPWKIIIGNIQSDSFSPAREGTVSGTLNRLIPALRRQNALARFTEKVEQATKQLPEWEGGPLLLALLKAENNDLAAAARLLEAGASTAVPSDAAMLVAGQLQRHRQLTPQLISLLEGALSSAPPAVRPYESTAGHMLTELLIVEGSASKARETALDTLARTDLSAIVGSDPEKQRRVTAEQLFSVARQFARHQQYVATLEFLEMTRQQNVELPRDLLFAAGALRRRALEQVRASEMVRWLSQGTRTAAPDLLLSYPQKPDDRISSAIVDRLAGAGEEVRETFLKTPGNALSPDGGNLSLAISTWLVAQRSQDSRMQQNADEWLTAWIKGAPEKKQSVEVGLWLVAREMSDSTVRQSLVNRAVEAAEALGDQARLQSILQEEGEIALKRGQPERADQAWSRLLRSVMSSTGNRSDDSVSSSVRELRARLLQQD